MRFMMLMIPKGYEAAEPGAMPDAERVAAMMEYNKKLQEAGVLLALDGLHPPSMGARVTLAGGKPKVVDGPSPRRRKCSAATDDPGEVAGGSHRMGEALPRFGE